MKRKVMTLCDNGIRIDCVKDDGDKYNPYRLYTVWYESGWHRKQLAKYADLQSAISAIADVVKTLKL